MNSINCAPLLSSRAMHKASVDVNLNTLMYLKKRYAPATRLTRRRWSRRKHINNWIPVTNVLKNWAAAYRFYKNHNRLLYYQFFTKRSFLAFDLVTARNSIPSLHKGSEDVVASTYTKRILNYFKMYSNPRLRFFLSFKYARPLQIACYPNPTFSTFNVPLYFESSKAVVPCLTDNVRSLTPLNDDENEIDLKPDLRLDLFRLMTQYFYSTLASVYKILVVLTVHRLL